MDCGLNANHQLVTTGLVGGKAWQCTSNSCAEAVLTSLNTNCDIQRGLYQHSTKIMNVLLGMLLGTSQKVFNNQ